MTANDNPAIEPDYVLAARQTAERRLPIIMEAAHLDFRKEWGIPEASFHLLVAAAMMQLTLGNLRAAAGRQPKQHEDFIMGLRSFSVMFGASMEIEGVNAP